ncbi:hypothetical protein VP01_6428g1, partial [Puccinia sorghi]
EENSPQVSSEDEGGEGGKAEGVVAKPLTNQQIKCLLSVFNYGSFSQITISMSHPTSHCSNSLLKSQPVKWPPIFWEDQQRSQRIQTDIASSKAMFLNQTPSWANNSIELVDYLGEKKGSIYRVNDAEKISAADFSWWKFYLVSGPLFDEFINPHNSLKSPGLESNFKENPDGFTCHLSFTISNFANKPHKEDDFSPFIFFMWIPIKQTTGNLVEENFEVKGGEFVFPDDSCGIKFSGFNGI